MANFTPEELEEILQQFFDVTGKRQYIGARYVPIFGRKNEDSIEWDNSAPYEPLTIVLYQGNSYTSRTYVPADVPITDTHFWANTGNYNAQVEQYRQDTLRVAEDLEELSGTVGDLTTGLSSEIQNRKLDIEKAHVFDTIADMKVSQNLRVGTICHTNGFHTSGDGGAAWYEITDSGDANEMDVIVCGNLFAHLIIVEPFVTPEMFGAYGDGVHDDSDNIQTAINKFNCITFNKEYNVEKTIIVKSNITLIGNPNSLFKSNVELNYLFENNDNCKNIKFIGLNFIGNMNVFPENSYPVRELGTIGDNDGLTHCIHLHGNNGDRTSELEFYISDIEIKECTFTNIYLLPVIIEGGINVFFENNTVINSLDCGFIDCTNLNVTNNMFIKSRDNGVSVSSGCSNCTISNNIVYKPAFNGIWCSGWLVDNTLYKGPKNFIVANNYIYGCGHSGVMCKYETSNGFISNNYIDTCYLHPYGENETIEAGSGVHIRGYTNRSNNINVKNNNIYNCKRNGVRIYTSEKCYISDNYFSNIGENNSGEIFNLEVTDDISLIDNKIDTNNSIKIIYGKFGNCVYKSIKTLIDTDVTLDSFSIRQTGVNVIYYGTLPDNAQELHTINAAVVNKLELLNVLYEYNTNVYRMGDWSESIDNSTRIFFQEVPGTDGKQWYVYNNNSNLAGKKFKMILSDQPIMEL